MPSRPDLRDIASNVKDAFADASRETLLEVLTFVIKEYVVEGPPPMLVHQAENLADLKGASFATLISALQTRFDFPELAMFVVDGENVSVRVGGVVQPLVAARQPPAPLPAPAAPPQPGVRVVETTTQQRPPQQAPAAPAAPREAPPPARGLSVRGRPSGDEPGAPSPAQPAAPQPAAPAQGAQSSDKGDKPDASGDDASARFSLLELD
ncbi:MAG: hypothetical protein H0T46_19470 [Deltaproteobacteria bacterium]|nr:hypothetical protein [Deltaproteobacteria bacterium]